MMFDEIIRVYGFQRNWRENDRGDIWMRIERWLKHRSRGDFEVSFVVRYLNEATGDVMGPVTSPAGGRIRAASSVPPGSGAAP